MKTHRSLFWFGPILILVCLLAQPVRVESQCMVVNTAVSMATTMGSPYTEVMKTLNAGYVCNSVGGGMSVSLCAPGGAMLRTMLTASAPTGAANPTCMFACTGTGGGTCATISISGADGLPVELMDFGFEDEESAD